MVDDEREEDQRRRPEEETRGKEELDLEGHQDLFNYQSAYLIAPNASPFLDQTRLSHHPTTLTTLAMSDPQN